MRRLWMIALSLSVGFALSACEKPGDGSSADQSYNQSAPAQGAAQGAAPVSGASGTVLETMNSGGYTYVQVEMGGEKLWAAGPEFAVKVGDSVVLSDGMPMPNYHSNSLDRTFDMIYFCNEIRPAGEAGSGGMASGEMPAGHPPISQAEGSEMDFSGIAVADGGLRVADLFAQKASLAGKPVVVRGKVVKVNNGIMGRNWFHLRDGSGESGSNDITVTTDGVVEVGQTVLVKGTVAVDKDFGAGYMYDMIIEGATVSVE